MTNAPATTQTFLAGVSMAAVPTAKGTRIDMVMPGSGNRRLRVSLRCVPHGRGHRLSFSAGWDGAMEDATLAEGMLAFGFQPLPVPVRRRPSLCEISRYRPGQRYVPAIRVAPGTRDFVGWALADHLGSVPSPQAKDTVHVLVRLAAMAMDPSLQDRAGAKALRLLRHPARKGGWQPL